MYGRKPTTRFTKYTPGKEYRQNQKNCFLPLSVEEGNSYFMTVGHFKLSGIGTGADSAPGPFRQSF